MIYITSSHANLIDSIIDKQFDSSLHPRQTFIHSTTMVRNIAIAALLPAAWGLPSSSVSQAGLPTTIKLLTMELQLQERDACTVTDYSGLATAVSSCTNIVLAGFQVPTGKQLDLSKLKAGTTVTFKGKTVSSVVHVSDAC